MKICFDISPLNDPKRTGIGVYEYELIKASLKIKKKDKFILFGFATLSNYGFLKNLFAKYPNKEQFIFKYPAKLFRTTFKLWQKIRFPFIEQLVGRIDIMHSFNWYVPPTINAKNIATVFDMTPIESPQWHSEKTVELDKLRFERIKQKADLVIAISEQTKKDFLRFSPKSNVEVIYPAASDIFSPKINKKLNEEVLKKYGLEKGYILSVCTLEPRKNLASLIKAFLNVIPSEERIQSKNPQLVLVGKPGWKNEEIEKLIEKNKDRLKILGYVLEKELRSLYQEALVFAYPSFYEGFGIPILEAMSCGTPVIISNTSSMPEVGGKAAVYIDPYNTKSIEKALQKFIDKPSVKLGYNKAVLAQAKKFSWEKSAKKLIKLYKNLEISR